MSLAIKSRLTGAENLKTAFGFMTRGAVNQAMRKGMTRGCMLMRDRMRAETPRWKEAETTNLLLKLLKKRGAVANADRIARLESLKRHKKLKLLRKSIGYRIKTYKTSVVGVCGPRRGFKTVINGRPHDPVKYAHIVENGRGPVVAKDKILSDGVTIYGTQVKATKPNPFMRRAFNATEAAAMRAITNAATEFFVAGALK